MPYEVVIIAPTAGNATAQREVAETFNPPFVMTSPPDEGSLTFSELDDTPVLTLLRPKRAEVGGDIARVLEVDDAVLARTDFYTEGFIPWDSAERGLALAYALAYLTDGVALVKGLPAW